jgi:hypothetical protein
MDRSYSLYNLEVCINTKLLPINSNSYNTTLISKMFLFCIISCTFTKSATSNSQKTDPDNHRSIICFVLILGTFYRNSLFLSK